MRKPTWMENTPCDGLWDLFFATEDEPEAVAAAKDICRTCSVRVACLDHAIREREEGGIWGGMTEAERRKNRREVTMGRRLAGCCPKCNERTPTIKSHRGQLECLDCGTRWSPL